MATVFWGDSMINGMYLDATAMAPYTGVDHVVYNGAVGGQDAAYLLAQFDAQPWRRHWAQVFWFGQHINGTAAAEVANVVAMVDQLDHDKFVVVSGSTDPHSATYQGPSGAQYLKVIEFNETLETLYPTKFLDLLGIMVADGVANADSQSVDYGGPPSYWCPTDIHFNSAGYVKAALEISTLQISLGHLSDAELVRQIAVTGGR